VACRAEGERKAIIKFTLPLIVGLFNALVTAVPPFFMSAPTKNTTLYYLFVVDVFVRIFFHSDQGYDYMDMDMVCVKIHQVCCVYCQCRSCQG